MRSVLAGLILAATAFAAMDMAGDVNAALARHDFAVAERVVRTYRATHAADPEAALAYSLMARAAADANALDKAEGYAAETRKIAAGLLKDRALDD